MFDSFLSSLTLVLPSQHVPHCHFKFPALLAGAIARNDGVVNSGRAIRKRIVPPLVHFGKRIHEILPVLWTQVSEVLGAKFPWLLLRHVVDDSNVFFVFENGILEDVVAAGVALVHNIQTVEVEVEIPLANKGMFDHLEGAAEVVRAFQLCQSLPTKIRTQKKWKE